MSDGPIALGHDKGGKKKPQRNPLTNPTYGYKLKQGRIGSAPKPVYTNPHGLGEILGNAKIQGVLNLFGDDPMLQGAREAASVVGGKPFTANQVMYMFDHASPGIRASIQSMMYRSGGLYAKKYVPTPGAPLTKQDRDAFKKFMIGVAANPAQGGVGDLLSQAADAGDAVGAASTSVYKPLVEEVTSPDDIKNTANAVGLQLHGTYLSSEQMKVFTAAYQTMEKAFQEQEYAAQGGDLASGMVTPAKATGAVVTKPTDVQSFAADAIRNQDPAAFKANTFTDRLNEIMTSLKGPGGNSGQVGPL